MGSAPRISSKERTPSGMLSSVATISSGLSAWFFHASCTVNTAGGAAASDSSTSFSAPQPPTSVSQLLHACASSCSSWPSGVPTRSATCGTPHRTQR